MYVKPHLKIMWLSYLTPDSLSKNTLTLSWRRPLSYRNQSIDLQCKSMVWFLYDNGPRDGRVKRVLSKTNKTIGLLCKVQNILPRAALITIDKTFVRPHLSIFYYKAYNNTFHEKIESIQYNACLTLTRAIRGTSKEKVYQ